jgi:hypothetical protein
MTSIAKHWRFETINEPVFNSVSMLFLSYETCNNESSPSYFCFVEWKNKQKETALKKYFGVNVTNVMCTQVFQIISEKNERKEFGTRSRQGKAKPVEKPVDKPAAETVDKPAAETVIKPVLVCSDKPDVESHTDLLRRRLTEFDDDDDDKVDDPADVENYMFSKYAILDVLLIMGFRDVMRIHNAMFGLRLRATELALFWFESIDQQPLQVAMAQAIIHKIEETSNIFESKMNKSSKDGLMTLLRERPHLFYRPKKSKYYEIIDKFTEKEIRTIAEAMDYHLDVDEELPKDFNIWSETCHKDSMNPSDPTSIACQGSDNEAWLKKYEMQKQHEKEQEERRKEWLKIKDTLSYRNSANMVKQIAATILEKELEHSLDPSDMSLEKITEAIKNYQPPKAEYGERVVHNCAHGENTKNVLHQRLAFLCFAEFHNFSPLPDLLAGSKSFMIPETLCMFTSYVYFRTFELEKKNRFERLVNVYSKYSGILNATDQFKTATGLPSAFMVIRSKKRSELDPDMNSDNLIRMELGLKQKKLNAK